MPIETLIWDRQSGAQGKIMYRVRRVQFGDGYEQAVQDGLNTEVQTWPLSFEGSMSVIQPIKDFFKRHAGVKSFYWTPPGESAPLLFRVDNVTLTSKGAGVYALSAELKQVFYP